MPISSIRRPSRIATSTEPGAETAAEHSLFYHGTAATGTIDCPALASIVDGTYLTIPDGTHEVKFEPRAKAQTTVAMKALVSIADNATLIVNDGTNSATTFEAQKTTNAYATGSITCPVASAFLDNETVTLNDGVNAASVIEFKRTVNAYATGSIVAVAKASLKNNETFVLNDGVNSATTFKFHTDAASAATGTVTCVAKASIKNNETVTIGDGTNTAVVFKFNMGDAAAAATGTITCVAKADLLDGETITIGDGTNTVVFEIDTDGGGVTAGRTQVDVSACTDAQSVGIKLASVINDVTTGLTVSATGSVAGVVDLLADASDYAHNVTITHTVANGGFAVTGMSGGISAFSAGGATEVDVSGATDAASVATILYGVANGVVGGLTVTAAEPTDEVVHLTADASDYTHNVTITHTVSNGGFAVTGMSGGITAFSAGGATEVDVTAATDAPSVAAIIRTAINNVGAGLAITAGAVDGSTVPLTNDAYGAYNTAVTDTVANAGFTSTGMSGGAVFTPAGAGVVVCDISAVTTAAQVAAALKSSINGIVAGLAITAGTITDATIALTNDAYGAYNTAIADTVVNAGFTHTGMSGGAVFTPTGGGVVVVDLRAISTDVAYAQAFATAINAVTTGLVVTAGTASGLTFLLTEDSTGSATITITGTAKDTATVVSAGLGGGTPVVGANEVDLTALPTAANGATKLTSVINAITTGLTVTARAAGARVLLTNDAVGIDGNVAIVQTGGTSYTVAGMSGGLDSMQQHAPALAALAERSADLLALLE